MCQGRKFLFMTLLMRNVSEDDFLAQSRSWLTCKGVQMTWEDKALEICCANIEILYYSCSFFMQMRRKFYEKRCTLVIRIVHLFSSTVFWFSLPIAAHGPETLKSLCINFLQHWQLLFLRHSKNLLVIGHKGQHESCKSCIMKTTGKTWLRKWIECIEWVKWMDVANSYQSIAFC